MSIISCEYGNLHLGYPEQDNRCCRWNISFDFSALHVQVSVSSFNMRLKTNWGHNVFFDYIDRWYGLTGGSLEYMVCDQIYEKYGNFIEPTMALYGPIQALNLQPIH